MLTIPSSDVRKEWSSVMDTVIREKPVFIKRTRDHMMLSDTGTIWQLISGVKFIADMYREDDGSVTLSARDMDIAVNGADEAAARKALVRDITEYAEEYYQDFERYSAAPNRQGHLPYVIKALVARSPEELEGEVVCRNGRT